MYLLILYLLVFIYCLLSLGFKWDNKKLNIAIFLVIVLFYTIRFSIGTDKAAYIRMFNTCNTLDEFVQVFWRYEFGFSFLLWISKTIADRFELFVLIYNIIVMGIFSYVTIKHSKNILITLLIFMASGIAEVYYASAMRQMLAMIVFYYAFYECLLKEKYISYYICSILAFSFQNIAFFMFFIPLLYKYREYLYKYKKQIIVLLSIVSIISSFVLPYIVSYLSKSINSLFVDSVARNLPINGSISILGIGQRFVLLGIYIGLYLLIDKTMRRDDDRFHLVIFFLSFFTYMCFMRSSIFSRACDFLEIIMLIYIPNCLVRIDTKRYMFAAYICISIVMLVLFINDLNFTVNSKSSKRKQLSISEYPYITVFEHDRINEIYDLKAKTE